MGPSLSCLHWPQRFSFHKVEKIQNQIVLHCTLNFRQCRRKQKLEDWVSSQLGDGAMECTFLGFSPSFLFKLEKSVKTPAFCFSVEEKQSQDGTF